MYEKIKKDVNLPPMQPGNSNDYSKGFTLTSMDSESAFEPRSIDSYQPSNLNQQAKTTAIRKHTQKNSWTSRDEVIKEENQENMNESVGNSDESPFKVPIKDIDTLDQPPSNLADQDPNSDNKGVCTPRILEFGTLTGTNPKNTNKNSSDINLNSYSGKRSDTANLNSPTTALRTDLLKQIFMNGNSGKTLLNRSIFERKSAGKNISRFPKASQFPTVSSGGCAE